MKINYKISGRKTYHGFYKGQIIEHNGMKREIMSVYMDDHWQSYMKSGKDSGDLLRGIHKGILVKARYDYEAEERGYCITDIESIPGYEN